MTAASRTSSAAVAKSNQGGGGFSWSVLLFLGPAALFLLVFLVYPTIYTLFLSFNRGRNGEFTEWVGLDNWVRLLTNDPNFLPSGLKYGDFIGLACACAPGELYALGLKGYSNKFLQEIAICYEIAGKKTNFVQAEPDSAEQAGLDWLAK